MDEIDYKHRKYTFKIKDTRRYFGVGRSIFYCSRGANPSYSVSKYIYMVVIVKNVMKKKIIRQASSIVKKCLTSLDGTNTRFSVGCIVGQIFR